MAATFAQALPHWPELEPFVEPMMAVRRVLDARHAVCIAYSGGKDSSALAAITLEAAREMAAAGAVVPPIYVTTADTGMDNPEVHGLVQAEHAKMRRFGEMHGFEVRTLSSTPNLLDSWVVRVVGGRALPTFASSSRDCTVSLKIDPMTKLQNSIVREIEASNRRAAPADRVEPLVVLTGTRLEESAVRARNMRARGEATLDVRREGKGRLFLSPLAFVASDEVFGLLSLSANGKIAAFSDFNDVLEVYRAAGGGECIIVKSDEAMADKKSRPCGSRTGCTICLAVGESDRSMEAMIESEPRYGYLAPLAALRRFIFNTRWDLNRRSWLGRTIDDGGYIAMQPDIYSPAMLEDLLKYLLTIDANEFARADRCGEEPKFEMISLEQIFAIEFQWSLHGFAAPWRALELYRDIRYCGRRYPVPATQPFPKPEMPRARRLYVGDSWRDVMATSGLRSPLHEAQEGCGFAAETLSDGREMTNWNVAPSLSIDPEGAALFLEFELDRHIEEARNSAFYAGFDSMTTLLSYGCISLSAGARAIHDDIARRTAWRASKGFTAVQVGNGRALYDAAEETRQRISWRQGATAIKHGAAKLAGVLQRALKAAGVDLPLDAASPESLAAALAPAWDAVPARIQQRVIAVCDGVVARSADLAGLEPLLAMAGAVRTALPDAVAARQATLLEVIEVAPPSLATPAAAAPRRERPAATAANEQMSLDFAA